MIIVFYDQANECITYRRASGRLHRNSCGIAGAAGVLSPISNNNILLSAVGGGCTTCRRNQLTAKSYLCLPVKRGRGKPEHSENPHETACLNEDRGGVQLHDQFSPNKGRYYAGSMGFLTGRATKCSIFHLFQAARSESHFQQFCRAGLPISNPHPRS